MVRNSHIFCLFILFFQNLAISQVKNNFNIELLSKVPLPEAGNDIWGFVDKKGTEYAVMGTRAAAYIYSLEDPKKPKLRYRAVGAISTWRDIKYYNNHLYVTADQDTFGLTIIDVSKAPDTITHTYWKPSITYNNASTVFLRAHNLYIDSLGFAYLAGHNISKRGVMILDLKKDPKNPELQSLVDSYYSHDAFVKGDKLYSSELSNGFGIYDISDRKNPKELGRGRSTNNFTHNAWLSADEKYLYTTDEVSSGTVDAFDVSDPSNIKFLDRIKTNPGFTRVIPHNTHFLNNYAITSWYTDGVIIKDVSDPKQMTIVGQYDTYPQDSTLPASGSLFFGCWGAYPYLPSGTLVASDINNGLFVLKPNYARSGLVKGRVGVILNKDTLTNFPVSVSLLNTDKTAVLGSKNDYSFKIPPDQNIGLVFNVEGFNPEIIRVTAKSNEEKQLNYFIKLRPLQLSVQSKTDKKPIQKAQFVINSSFYPTVRNELQNGSGSVYLDSISSSNIYVGAWGYRTEKFTIPLSSKDFVVELTPEYSDPFILNTGWIATSKATGGNWELAKPIQILNGNVATTPNGDDRFDEGEGAYVTGNGSGVVGSDDVDNGEQILESPPFDLSSFNKAGITNTLWFYNGGGSNTPNDTFTVQLINDRGAVYNLEKLTTNTGNWVTKTYNVNSANILFTKNMKLRYIAGDYGQGHLVEAGVDNVKIVGEMTTSIDLVRQNSINCFPNPASDHIYFKDLTFEENTQYEIFDSYGKRIKNGVITNEKIDISTLISGQYFVLIKSKKEILKAQFTKI
jgi:choice-of-anchor B domain-containing protein